MVREILKILVMIGIAVVYLGSFIIASIILTFKFPDEEDENETNI